jgi:hypothetical protein
MSTNTQVKTNLSTLWNSTSGTSYSTIPLLSGISHKDQLEIERPFTTPTGITLKQEDLRSIYVIPYGNYTVDETNKKITAITAPATYVTSSNVTVTIPAISNGDVLRIRRKSISNESLVSWVDGSRLTASQLNLQTNQLLNLTQEILDRLKYEYVTSTDIDYNATYNSATRTWVEDRLGSSGFANSTQTVKGYVDSTVGTRDALITALNTKVGISETINGSSNTNVVTKLNYLDGLLGSQLFTGFPQSSIVIVGTNGSKDYSTNFTLTKGSPDVLNLTGNQNITGKLSVQGTSTNDIVSFKNSSGIEVNKIDQYGNLLRAAASTDEPSNPINGTLWFNANAGNQLQIWDADDSLWRIQGSYTGSLNFVGLAGNESISGNKCFTGNTGFGMSAGSLGKLDVQGTSGITSFTGTTRLGATVRGATSTTDYSGIDFTGGATTEPKARIASIFGASGSKLQFGTSNNYTNGITNTALTIGSDGNVGIAQSSPSYNLDITGTLRTTENTLVEGTLRSNGVTSLMANVGIGTTSPQRNLTVYNSTNPTIQLVNDTSLATNADGIILQLLSSDGYLWNYENGALSLGTNNTERLRITGNGGVGIGTNNPTTLLHLNTTTTSNLITQTNNSGGSLQIGINSDGAGLITHTGPGIVNPLTISSTQGISFIGSDVLIQNTKQLKTNTISSVGTELTLQIDAGNKVGIGTSIPSEKLEVSGNIKTTTGNKIISDTVETGIIQSSGTIEFRQGYTASTTPDMTINADGEVIFAKAPKVNTTAFLIAETPVIAGPYSSSGTNFRFGHASTITHYNQTTNPVMYRKIGPIVYVTGILSTTKTIDEDLVISNSNEDSNGNSLLRNLPIPANGGKAHFLAQAWCCFKKSSNEKYHRQRMIISGYISPSGNLRINGRFWRGGDQSGTSMWSGTSTPQTSSDVLMLWREGNGLGASPTTGSQDIGGTNNGQPYLTPSGTQDYLGFYAYNEAGSNNIITPSSQYIIFNFSYLTA